MAGEVRTRRNRSYWEPIYDPDDHEPFPEVPVDHNRTGFRHATINPNGFGSKKKFENDRFDICNFNNVFKNIVFNGCHFSKCDFGLSTWEHAKFTRCSFVKCSFTQSTFANCDFRACSWEDIGLAGNETNFRATVISNPAQFIGAAYTNLDTNVLKNVGANKFYQKVRLQRTKANVARRLLNVLMLEGEESWYYEAVRIYYIETFRIQKGRAAAN